jgi:hypothetical protein
MADDVLQDASPAPDAGKVKRDPPTIDLEATQVSESSGSETKASENKASETKAADAPRPEPEANSEPPKQAASEPKSRRASPWLVAPLSGVAAAAVVIAVGSFLGWPAEQSPPSAPQASAAAVDDLTTRVAGLESKIAKPPAPVIDPAMNARLEQIEKSVAALRGDVANLRTQSDKLAASVNAPRAPGEAVAAPAVDLSAVNERIDQIERATRAQAAAIAQVTAAKAMPATSQDDAPLRRVVAAALLDVAVRHGDPFGGALTAAKALAPDPNKLKPLDAFADKGIPAPPALCRELLTLVPKLAPASDNSPAGAGIVDRLKAGASNLVRIERTDVVGSDRSAVVARATAAALRNDFPEARRELASLDAADRAPAQAWLDKSDARDAALAASRQFAEDTMAALAKSAQ